MLASVIQFSLTQRLFIAVITLVIMALGARAWLQMPIDAFPDISPTQVKVILKVPGMTAEEIELQVTQPIETELLGIPRQDMLRSTTKYAITDITLDFTEGTDIYWARQQVNERLLGIWGELPENVSGGVAPISTPLGEMFMFTVEHPTMSLREKRQLLDWEIRPLLRTVEGVADVNVLGGEARSFQVAPNAALMAAAGVSFTELEDSIAHNNLNSGAGRLVQGNDAFIVRTEGRINTLQQLRQLVIKERQGQVYRLQDIASVNEGHLTRYGAVTRNGTETAEALVIALKNANTNQVVQGVKAKLKSIQASLPPGTEINVFYDRATLIERAINTISSALIEAVILVIILLTAFLGNLRAALVVSLSLPLAALSTFLLMQQFGLTANLMSLGGLVIAIGMIVDSSVVMVENMVQQLAEDHQLPRMHRIFRACKDVATPVVSGTLIVVIVFSPLLTLSGLEGKLFVPVALTIVFAMLSALVLSLTVIPAIASVLLRDNANSSPKWVVKLQENYRDSLHRLLVTPRPALIVSATALLLGVLVFTQVGKTFMPVLDEGDLIVQLEKSPGISLQASVEMDQQIEQALLQRVPEIRQIVARVGSDEIGLDPMGLNETDVFMELAPREEWQASSKTDLIAHIRAVVSDFPGVSFGFTQPIQMRTSEMLTGSAGDVSIKIFGNGVPTLAGLAIQLTELTRQVDGSVDVQSAVIEGGKFLNIQPRREIGDRYGLSVEEFSRLVKTQFEGVAVSEIIEGKRRIPIMLKTGPDDEAVTSIEALAQRQMILPDHSLAPLRDLAELSFKSGPLVIEREKGNRFAVVTSNVIKRDVVGFVAELEQLFAENVDLPAGYNIVFGGEFENQRRASATLLTVVPAALLLILIILFTTFRSMAKAGLILANIPFASVGGIVALYLSGEYLSVPASVGFIALLGMAVLNGVVMISYFEQNRVHTASVEINILDGAERRLRPILMTATTAMFGLMPLVFASGPGAEIQRPLAIVVIGGLLTSTVTTLYLLPLFYAKLEDRNHA
jgi:cobalt-zinc-cadmium resistance protein CzcA